MITNFATDKKMEIVRSSFRHIPFHLKSYCIDNFDQGAIQRFYLVFFYGIRAQFHGNLTFSLNFLSLELNYCLHVGGMKLSPKYGPSAVAERIQCLI